MPSVKYNNYEACSTRSIVPHSRSRGSFWDVFLSKNKTMEKVKDIYHINKKLVHTDYNVFQGTVVKRATHPVQRSLARILM
jgi:hypothetical protein